MIEEALAAFELAHERAFLEPFLGFQITLVSDPEARSSRSRIGGGAELGPGVEWPLQRWLLSEVQTWPEYARNEVKTALERGTASERGNELVMPLSFLFQIELAEVPPSDETALLPRSGLLSFFASIATDLPDPRYAKRVAGAVLYESNVSRLVHTPQPPTGDPYPSRALGLRFERQLCADLPWEEKQALAMRNESRIVKRFENEVCALRDSLLPRPSEECAGPMPPLGEIALARLLEHDELELFIGDASWVTFSIPEADLRAHRFENACAAVYVG
jgi:hypothetical protein